MTHQLGISTIDRNIQEQKEMSPMSSQDRTAEITKRPEYLAKVQDLRTVRPVSKQLLGLTGRTINGEFVFLPGSYEKGFADALPSQLQQRFLQHDYVFFGSLSDGSIVYPPSYRQGQNAANQCMNAIKIEVLAEGERHLFAQNQQFKIDLSNLRQEFEELKTRKLSDSDSSNEAKP